MRPIVLATDGSVSAGAAVERAVELAAESQATLLVVTVWDSPYTGLRCAPLPVVVDVNAEMVERAPSHHWGRVRRALHGSVSQGVVQSAHCPVLVVPAAPVSEA